MRPVILSALSLVIGAAGLAATATSSKGKPPAKRMTASSGPNRMPPSSGDAKALAERALNHLEDLDRLATLNRLDLSPAQASSLIELLAWAKEQRKQILNEEDQGLAALQPALEQARQLAVRGRPLSREAEAQLTAGLAAVMQTSRRKDQEVVREVADRVWTLLGGAQLERVGALVQQNDASTGANPAGPGKPGKGKAADAPGKMLGKMGKLRDVSSEQYEVERVKFAEAFMKGVPRGSPIYEQERARLLSLADRIRQLDTGGLATEGARLAEELAARDDHAKQADALLKLHGARDSAEREKFIDRFTKGLDPQSAEYQQARAEAGVVAERVSRMSPQEFAAQQAALASRLAQREADRRESEQAQRAAKQQSGAAQFSRQQFDDWVKRVLMHQRTLALLREQQRAR